MTDDVRCMRAALRLAARGEGRTRPNPPVGAVVCRGKRVVGRGYHHAAGQPHAEILAMREAGPRCQGATLYVTLEPCSTTGRTPPCTEAILRHGIRRVVVAERDPNPRHNGRGLAFLRRNGVVVDMLDCGEVAARLLAPFAAWVGRGTPFLTLKLATSLDGCIADRRGRSRWISSAPARACVQDLRRRADAILVGAGTVARDNPQLLPRPARGRRPLRVVVASRGDISLSSKVLRAGEAGRTLIAVTRACPTERRTALGRHGAEVAVLPAAGGRVALPALLRELAARDVMSVLCEGGAELAGALSEAGLVDEYIFIQAPVLLGGGGLSALAGAAGWELARAPRLEIVETRRLGPDAFLRARAHNKEC